MPIIHIHSPETTTEAGPLYVPRDERFNLAPLVAGLALRGATLTLREGGYVGDITPSHWNKENTPGSFWLEVQDEGELATVSFVPYREDSQDIDLFGSSQLDGPITSTRNFVVRDSNCVAVSRPAPPGVEIGGLIMHATDPVIEGIANDLFSKYEY